jgi:hypothetical protein
VCGILNCVADLATTVTVSLYIQIAGMLNTNA